MNRVKRMATAVSVSALVLTGVAVTAAAPASAMPIPGDNGCYVTANGSPGWKSMTLHVTSNNCGRRVQAYVHCSQYGMYAGSNWIAGTGDVTVNCDGWTNWASSSGYGYEVYEPAYGIWESFQLG